MTLGTFGSTLSDELNRLANGGTYRTMGNMVDDALAAKQWANRENINPYSTDTVGVLNEIAGLGTNRQNWLDFNGVCNYIAGTTGLPAAAALRQVYPTTDLLTGVASYYVDATQATNWGSLGYVYLDGSAGNTLIVANAQAPTVTGDFEAIVTMAADDWTPSAGGPIFSNWGSADPNRKYNLQLNSNGTLSFQWTPNGNYASRLTSTSTVAPTVADGATLSIKVTLDVDNGASGNDTKFFTSTNNGATWTQLGSTITKAGTTSINGTGTADFRVARWLDDNSSVAGKYYQVIIKNGIDGTTLLNINIANDYKAANLTEFTATTGQLVSVAGTPGNTVVNSGAAGSLLPTTLGSSTAADSNDPKFLDFTGTNYVYLPGSASNYLSVADSAALDITGDLDLRVLIAADSWALPSGTNATLIGKDDVSSNRSYLFSIIGGSGNSSLLQLSWSTGGSGATRIVKTSTVTIVNSVAAGAPLWVRTTLDVDNGASGNDVKFFTSTDGTTWTQLGATVTTAGTTSIFAGTAEVRIGIVTTLEPLSGKIFRAQIFNGIDGTKVLDVDTSVITAGSATSFTAVTGQTVTINRSTSGRKTVAVTQPTWLFGTDDYMEVNNRYMSSGTYLYLPGVNSNNAAAPDSAAISITGDLDIRCKVALDDWTPAAATALISKNFNWSYELSVQQTTGLLILQVSTDGTTALPYVSTAAPTVADGATLWVRATRVASTGVVKFFTSTDGTTWTQLGVDVAGVTGNLFDSGASLSLGGRTASNPLRGKLFRAQILNGIDGTVAFDANFETSITSLNQASFTESSANAATVTINRSGSAYRSAGITAAGYLYPGATNTFAASATDFLNFGTSDSFTVVSVLRYWNTMSQNRTVISKINGSTADLGYANRKTANALTSTILVSDGTNSATATASALTAGALEVNSGIVNRTTQTSQIYSNSAASATASISTVGSLSNPTRPLRIATYADGANYADMEFIAGAVFRSALSATQIRQIVNYFANREAYL